MVKSVIFGDLEEGSKNLSRAVQHKSNALLEAKGLKKEVDSPPKRDVVDWDDVVEAGKQTAKKVHGKVDKEKLDGVIENAKKHKPDSTPAAIEIVQDMIRSGYKEAVKEQSETVKGSKSMSGKIGRGDKHTDFSDKLNDYADDIEGEYDPADPKYDTDKAYRKGVSKRGVKGNTNIDHADYTGEPKKVFKKS